MSGADTKTEILDAAEQLFAEFGYAATSLRQITTAAGANLAAVNYHFGSKEELAKAVLARRIGPINDERLQRLDALGKKLGKKAAVADIIRAFLAPPLRLGGTVNREEGHGYRQRLCRMFGRISTEQPPFLRTFLATQFRDVGSRFERALAAALPGKSAAAIWWRIHFVVGAMAHTLQNSEALAHLTGNLCDPSDVDALEDQLVAFAAGGMSAAEPPKARRKKSALGAR
ncbi:MAG: TetR family transcriptional regulator [Planctomycetes bacterium]|jgi:AcrR family transcriptional regulator|nr:TetR family transcriptional regulator [Planctomycetota bacterium]